jgi:6,7-dimethyl-8-ribityllumazine synthase
VSEPYDRTAGERDLAPDPMEDARENVLDGWPSSEDVSRFSDERRSDRETAAFSSVDDDDRDEAVSASVVKSPVDPEPHEVADADAEAGADAEPEAEVVEAPAPLVDPEPVRAEPIHPEPVHPGPIAHSASEHAPGDLQIPPGFSILEGAANGARRAVGVVVSRFNGKVTSRLLESALDELSAAGVATDAVTVMPVPGAFELPIGAMALAKTRRYACIVALGCVIRGDTPHFDYVAAEAASGLQLAALETGVPVSFGVLTLERADQADARVDKGAEAVRTALEMADLFAHLRAAAAR